MQDSGGPGGLFEPLKQKKVKNDKILFPPEIFCGRCLQRNLTKFFFPQKYSVVDAFKNFEGSEEEKNSMQGYITRAKMTDKAHASLGGINVVPDEDNKKLLITEMICEGEKKVFVCHRCSDLTTLNNARSIDYEELKKNACNHSKLSEILFGDQEIQKKPDGKKNIIDVVKNSSELIAIVFPSEEHGKRPGVIQITSRSKRPRCDI